MINPLLLRALTGGGGQQMPTQQGRQSLRSFFAQPQAGAMQPQAMGQPAAPPMLAAAMPQPQQGAQTMMPQSTPSMFAQAPGGAGLPPAFGAPSMPTGPLGGVKPGGGVPPHLIGAGQSPNQKYYT